MAIKNVAAGLSNSISNVSVRVRAIGRNVSERPTGPFQQRGMIGTDIARIGVFSGHNAAQGTNIGFAGSNLAPSPFAFSGAAGFNKGAVQDAVTHYTQRRFGRIDSNLGFNRISGLQKGSRS